MKAQRGSYLAEEPGKGEPAVACKGEHLPRGRRERADGGAKGHEGEEGGHDDGAGRAGRVGEDLDEGEAGRRDGEGLRIGDAEAKGDEHDEAGAAVAQDSPKHTDRHRAGRVADFLGYEQRWRPGQPCFDHRDEQRQERKEGRWRLTHMRWTVDRAEAKDGPRETDQDGEARRGPAAAVGELREDGRSRRVRSAGPQGRDDGHKPEDVEDEDYGLHDGQHPGEQRVAGDGHPVDGDGQEGAVHGCVRVARIEQGQQARDLDSRPA